MEQTSAHSGLPHRALWLGALYVAEMAVLVAAFQVFSDIECRATAIEAACRGLRWVALWVVCAVSLLGVYLWARPEARAGFARITGTAPGGRGWQTHAWGCCWHMWALGHALGCTLPACFGMLTVFGGHLGIPLSQLGFWRFFAIFGQPACQLSCSVPPKGGWP